MIAREKRADRHDRLSRQSQRVMASYCSDCGAMPYAACRDLKTREPLDNGAHQGRFDAAGVIPAA